MSARYRTENSSSDQEQWQRGKWNKCVRRNFSQPIGRLPLIYVRWGMAASARPLELGPFLWGLRRWIMAPDKQAIDLQQAVYAALRKRDGAMVVGEGAPARWSSP